MPKKTRADIIRDSYVKSGIAARPGQTIRLSRGKAEVIEGVFRFKREEQPHEYTVHSTCLDGVMRYVGRVEQHKDWPRRPMTWAAYRGSRLLGKFATRHEAAQRLLEG